MSSLATVAMTAFLSSWTMSTVQHATIYLSLPMDTQGLLTEFRGWYYSGLKYNKLKIEDVDIRRTLHQNEKAFDLFPP
ncbi:hypothetical protein N7489_007900 [Penicillium chrysogenum]|uniref:uncharacterized protein n=1 Tax=Penicillium chrysogenum TaxID=5076 RepID=UPI00238AA0C6|nr:uncharacterized protein N7489_007900 [Penicillium chrysogenum]KAJ5237809.1 hypothetical protein N7489_007900 [Penicillium chrysogenum]KAJ5278110.1 hypothetical protein N7524_004263 [Penicillium chrysogenum]